MQGWLYNVRMLITNALLREPAVPSGGNSSHDSLPPILGPSEWSDGLMASMAHSAPWYLDRWQR